MKEPMGEAEAQWWRTLWLLVGFGFEWNYAKKTLLTRREHAQEVDRELRKTGGNS